MVNETDKGVSVHIITMLKKWRAKAGLSTEAVAEELDTSSSNYNKIENGHVRLSVENALKLSQVYNISLDKLVGWDHAKKELLPPDEVLLMAREKRAEYKKTETPRNIIIQFGEGKNSPRTDRFLERLGKAIAGYDPDNPLWEELENDDPPVSDAGQSN